MTIVNYVSSIVNKLEALLTDIARVVIDDRHVFVVQATGGQYSNIHLNVAHIFHASVNSTSVAA